MIRYTCYKNIHPLLLFFPFFAFFTTHKEKNNSCLFLLVASQSNYKDSNDANFGRLTDKLAAAKAFDDKIERERNEILRKEQMAEMFLKYE